MKAKGGESLPSIKVKGDIRARKGLGALFTLSKKTFFTCSWASKLATACCEFLFSLSLNGRHIESQIVSSWGANKLGTTRQKRELLAFW
ncbi:hypothetical protein GOP47_0006208 [Adiantum capillus-veneris]|uniref:Uncharacterized protein n=1 Tax=Adiantum capillus-veneris TaxID=13818 RepID=A0A9D4V3Y8_ADICA|nr:hypothetical protein GOP47_0006208 [Adiantum capillus-veneris]